MISNCRWTLLQQQDDICTVATDQDGIQSMTGFDSSSLAVACMQPKTNLWMTHINPFIGSAEHKSWLSLMINLSQAPNREYGQKPINGNKKTYDMDICIRMRCYRSIQLHLAALYQQIRKESFQSWRKVVQNVETYIIISRTVYTGT